MACDYCNPDYRFPVKGVGKNMLDGLDTGEEEIFVYMRPKQHYMEFAVYDYVEGKYLFEKYMNEITCEINFCPMCGRKLN